MRTLVARFWSWLFVIAASLGWAGIVSAYVIVIGFIIGWFMNIWKFFWMIPGAIEMGFAQLQMEFVLRIAGIPIGPLGGVMGWM